MAHGIHQLTATAVRNACKPGPKPRRITDGGGLYLVISTTGAGKWVLRVVQAGSGRRDIGLGGVRDVTLVDARERANAARRKARAGVDVVAERKVARSKGLSFEEAARAVHAENLPTWKNAKHAAQWISTLEAYAFPLLGEHAIEDVTSPMVRDVLSHIWLTRQETARRVRQRICTVIDWAVSKGLREHELNMRAITRGLPKQRQKVRHHAALAYDEVPDFIDRLRQMDGSSEAVRAAFEVLILTATRSGEVRGMCWSEVDLESRLWSIPADRMKAGEPHVVPLSDRVVELLRAASETNGGGDGLVFESSRRGRPLSDMTLTALLRRHAIPCTAHGFRSSFRDWAAEQTGFGRDLAEMALAHRVGDATERAYARSTLLEKRRALMDAWAAYCGGGVGGNIVALVRAGA